MATLSAPCPQCGEMGNVVLTMEDDGTQRHAYTCVNGHELDEPAAELLWVHASSE